MRTVRLDGSGLRCQRAPSQPCRRNRTAPEWRLAGHRDMTRLVAHIANSTFAARTEPSKARDAAGRLRPGWMSRGSSDLGHLLCSLKAWREREKKGAIFNV